MKKEDLLKEMRDSVGTKDPILFFEKMVDVFSLLFDRIDHLEKKIGAVTVAASHWDSRLASDMIAGEVQRLRNIDRAVYHLQISTLKAAYAENKVTQNYEDFVKFWQDTLGWHPFLDNQ